MDLEYSEDELILKDSFARFARDHSDFDAWRKVAASDLGYSRENWARFAELGWLALPFPEADGGYGVSLNPTLLLFEQFGRGLVLEPYLPTVLLFGGVVRRATDYPGRQATLGRIIEGSLLGSLAYLERQSRYQVADIGTTLTPTSNGFVLNGEKVLVLNGAAADQLVVTARSHGGPHDTDGVSLVVLDSDDAGISRTPIRLMDGRVVANIQFDNVAVPKDRILGQPGKGYPIFEDTIAEATLAVSAEAVGILQALNEITLLYVKTRKQFGTSIGSFQALQHRLVEMFAAYEQARSLLYRAICSVEERGLTGNSDIAALKVMVGKAGRLIGGEAIQLHGGMGITDELNVGHYVKRLMTINTAFGDADFHRRVFASLRYDALVA